MADGAWHILGPGALGTLLALQFKEAGLVAHLLHHEQGTERSIVWHGETHHFAVTPVGDLAPRSIGGLLVCSKAPQVAAALGLISPRLAKDAVVIALANGMGFEDSAEALAIPGGLRRAVTTAGAYRDADGVVHGVARGTTRVGSPGQRDAEAPRWFLDSLQRLASWQWDPRIDEAVGRKFSINCAINALTAQLHCRNGELWQNPQHRRRLSELCAELDPALRGLGLWSGAPLLDTAGQVCRETAGNQSSMLQDVLAGRSTEIDYLNGALLRLLPDEALPHNRALVASLRSA